VSLVKAIVKLGRGRCLISVRYVPNSSAGGGDCFELEIVGTTLNSCYFEGLASYFWVCPWSSTNHVCSYPGFPFLKFASVSLAAWENSGLISPTPRKAKLLFGAPKKFLTEISHGVRRQNCSLLTPVTSINNFNRNLLFLVL
jgi:hypothetical protein